MTQLALSFDPLPRNGDEWQAPSGLRWTVTDVDGARVTMQHVRGGFPRTVTHTATEWRRQGWRPVRER